MESCNTGKRIGMNIIALADKNWAIGNNGRLLVDIPEDKKLFRGKHMERL